MINKSAFRGFIPLIILSLSVLLWIGISFIGMPAALAAQDENASPGDTVEVNGDTAAASSAAELKEQMTGLDMETIEKHLTELNRDMNTYMPQLDLKEMLAKLAHGELGVSLGDIFSGLLKYLFKEMVANSRLMGQLLILAVLCAILQNVQSAFEKGTVGKLAWSVCFLALLSLALGSFTIAMQTGRQAIEDMVSFMHAMLPVLITLLTAMGNITTASLFHPLTLMVLSTISTLIKNVIFPLIFFSVILGLANKITTRVDVSKLADLLKNWSMGLLGLFFTVFLGFMMVQGIAGSVADGVAMRTAKFGIGVFVPVVGKLFSDALEAVVGTSLLLKNAVGLVGILAVFFICAFPVLKILALMLIYKIAAALIQPIGDTLIADSLNIMGNSLTIVFASVTAVGIMFFFVIAIVVGAGDFSLMLR
ncbi:stage III sporulation protein AE [Phosphitispora fastidiosa]|uniref:stage III sporulation protein AE n=1 Tax=Phosphitispora fastidiosa TaxID=2837202 RepID=UPI001E49015F|nr:stage III sporulation protein AE [Phosphitispora fastidiosa]MBU7007630.1 stage III sporulation protein AE [Phosphitispora fastidiosa]